MGKFGLKSTNVRTLRIWGGLMLISAGFLLVFQNCADGLSGAFKESNITNMQEVSNLSSTSSSLILAPPLDSTVFVGDTLLLQVQARTTTGVTYQWKQNGVAMAGQTNANLTITAIQAAQAAKYSVIVSNGSFTEESRAATVYVFPAPTSNQLPSFDLYPRSQTVIAGSSVAFSVDAIGYPEPTYQWYKNGAAISGATTRELRLDNVQSGANYYVSASNSVGTVVSSGAQLVVSP